jgi:hypothetical protein
MSSVEDTGLSDIFWKEEFSALNCGEGILDDFPKRISGLLRTLRKGG